MNQKIYALFASLKGKRGKSFGMKEQVEEIEEIERRGT